MYTALCMTYQTLLTIGRSLCDLAALIYTYGLNKIDCSESCLGIVNSLVLPNVSFFHMRFKSRLTTKDRGIVDRQAYS